jgi:mRNA interferase RelE/StbE
LHPICLNSGRRELRDTHFLRRTPGHPLFLNPSGMAGPPADLVVTVPRILGTTGYAPGGAGCRAPAQRRLHGPAVVGGGTFQGISTERKAAQSYSRPIATRSQVTLSFRSCPGVNCQIHFIMHEIRYRKAALKALTRLPTDARHRILEALRKLAESADTAALDIKALQGRDGFRLRVGKWRIIYHKDDNAMIILVVDAGSRGDIYK